jgi:hypothetical protein
MDYYKMHCRYQDTCLNKYCKDEHGIPPGYYKRICKYENQCKSINCEKSHSEIDRIKIRDLKSEKKNLQEMIDARDSVIEDQKLQISELISTHENSQKNNERIINELKNKLSDQEKHIFNIQTLSNNEKIITKSLSDNVINSLQEKNKKLEATLDNINNTINSSRKRSLSEDTVPEIDESDVHKKKVFLYGDEKKVNQVFVHN